MDLRGDNYKHASEVRDGLLALLALCERDTYMRIHLQQLNTTRRVDNGMKRCFSTRKQKMHYFCTHVDGLYIKALQVALLVLPCFVRQTPPHPVSHNLTWYHRHS